MLMDLIWNEAPVTDTVCFSRDQHDKFILVPTIKELWTLTQSPTAKAEVKDGGGSKLAENALSSDLENGSESKDESGGFPEPRVPYPRLSALTSREQAAYLRVLTRKAPPEPYQQLHERVQQEVSDFLKYLKDVAKVCAEDYKYMPEGAALFAQEYVKACAEKVRSYPQTYLIYEMTSMTGGKFTSDLSLNLEKQLLTMGKVNVADLKSLPRDVRLAVDYDSVALKNTPVKKADQTQADISSDENAEKLCSRYEPHVCLTSEAIVRLLNNHGPEFSDAWDLPLWVTSIPGKGTGSRKAIFIDSPLVRTDIHARERSSLFHEESLKQALKMNGHKKVFHLMLENADRREDKCNRNLVSFDDAGLDFEMDVTDLETFGETSHASKVPQRCKQPDTSAPSQPTCPPETPNSAAVADIHAAEEAESSWTDVEERSVEEMGLSEASAAKRLSLGSSGDSDDDRLVIDQEAKPAHSAQTGLPGIASPSVKPGSREDFSATSPLRARKKGGGKASRGCDQLGRIMRMQDALLKPNTGMAEEPPHLNPPPALPQTNPQSLVKPCVTSFLESSQSPARNPGCDTSSTGNAIVRQKPLLSDVLLASGEDELDYRAPEEGNLLYNLYSLQDLLLLVRSSVPLACSRKVDMGPNKLVPFHLLPKLEYQLCYGLERLTQSEACQLWAQRLLHSSTVSYIGRIDALTSKLLLMEEITQDKIRNASCKFKPAKSLNILHHLLKKVAGLQEGRYLLSHKSGEPFITIVKATEGTKPLRAVYDLHLAHSAPPQTRDPPAGSWVPVDPTQVLPFHIRHGRVPCTFPPRTISHAQGKKAGAAKAAKPSSAKGVAPAGPAEACGNQGGAKKKKNKGKRKKRLQVWKMKRNQKRREQERHSSTPGAQQK